MAHMTIRSPSSSASSVASGEEVVVFRGRAHNPPTQAAPSAPAPAAPIAPSPEQDDSRRTPAETPQLTGASSDEQASLPTEALATMPGEPSVSAQEPAIAPQPGSDVDSDTNSVIQHHFERRRGGRPIWEGRTTPWVSRSKPGIGWLPVRDRPNMDAFLRGDVNPQDAAMDDYMQNVEDFGLKDEMVASAGFARREMHLDAGSHNDWESDPGEPAAEDGQGEWDSDALGDFNHLSTSSDVMDTIARIISKRTRPSGVQYLAVYEDSTPDDARWFPASFFNTPADQELIRKFEATLLHTRRMTSSSGSSESGSDLDEEDKLEFVDETIARLLQKQEELGLGSEEVMLYGGDAFFGGPVSAAASSRAFDRPSKKRQHRAGGGRRTEPSFPSAAAMSDALEMDPYGGFDIMDTERPSLRPRKKGRRSQMPPELDDSDLNDQIQASWEADRVKKRLKKAEREELRKLGLLGRKGKAPDLSVRYKDGVNAEDILDEIRDFMSSDMQTLSLPPMEAHRRAAIHQFVSHLGVSSRSRGDGTDRFTVLSKTKRTIYDDSIFEAFIEKVKLKNRWRGPPGAGTKQFKGPKLPKATKGSKSRPVVSYKDGETVGASAPELGPENRGRALLEKMGWSKGMGLGAHDNKGILHPIAHVVKTNKAGLQ